MEKKLLMLAVVLAVVVLTTSSVLALDPMGPPTAGLKQGEWKLGVDYMFSNTDVEADGISELDLVSGTVKDVEMNKVFANIGTGLSDDLEIFLRLGGAGVKPDEHDNLDNIAGYIGSGSGFAIGCGMKTTLFQSDDGKIKWGALAQMSWADLDFDTEHYSVMGYDVSLSADASIIEAQFAFGPTVQLSEGFSVYGGPFLRILDGDVDLKGSIDELSGKVSTDIEEDSIFGGYIGAQFDIKPGPGQITNGCYIFCEGQFTADGWGVGTGMGWKF